jgi:hypothetical protein
MNYVIDDDFGGVPEGGKYRISGATQDEEDWRALLAAFASRFSEFTSDVHIIGGKRDQGDFEFPDWHYEMRSLCVYLYNEKFYNEDFIPKVQAILKKQSRPAYAHFECYDSNAYKEYGSFMVFTDNVIFDRLSEESGLIRRLMPMSYTATNLIKGD